MKREIGVRLWAQLILTVTIMILSPPARAAGESSPSWGGFMRALAAAGRTTDSQARVQRQAELCEQALSIADAPVEVKEGAQLKLASLLIPGNHGTPQVSGLSDPKRGLKLGNRNRESGDTTPDSKALILAPFDCVSRFTIRRFSPPIY